MSHPHCDQSQALVDDAWATFAAIVADAHVKAIFGELDIGDVWKQVRELQEKLAQQQRARNFRKLQLLFQRLTPFARAAKALGIDTRARNWAWAPIVYYLTIASDHPEALDALLDTYANIGREFPDFDRAHEDHETIALVLCDLLEFHGRIHLIFTRTGWTTFFTASWKRARPYIDTVLSSLSSHAARQAHHDQLCSDSQPASAVGDPMGGQRVDIRSFHTAKATYSDIAATAFARQHNGDHIGDIVNSLSRAHTTVLQHSESTYGEDISSSLQAMRKHFYDQAATAEKERSEALLVKILEWLDPSDHGHEDDFESLNNVCHPGTTDWFIAHKTVKLWAANGTQSPKVWIYGKPGCGKSVLSVQLIQHIQREHHAAVIFYLCNFRAAARNDCMTFARSCAAQIMRMHPDMTAHVFETFVVPQVEVSLHGLKKLTKTLLGTLDHTRLIIDGLDEYHIEQQTKIIDFAFDVAKSTTCKIMVFSQNAGPIGRCFKRLKAPSVSMSEERSAVDASIRIFVKHQLATFKEDEDSIFAHEPDLMEELESQLVLKADGMFLWVRLVLSLLESASSKRDLRRFVDQLPKGIEKVYARILHQLQDRQSAGSVQYTDVFRWLAFAERPLYVQELLGALSYSVDPFELTDDTKLSKAVLECGKPFVEVTPSGLVTFVHATVRRYLLAALPTKAAHSSPLEAQRTITMACCRALTDGLELIDTNSDTQAQQHVVVKVVRGFFDMHSYALRHWVSHLKHYLTLHPAHQTRLDEAFELVLHALAQRHMQLVRLFVIPAPVLSQDSDFITSLRKLCQSDHLLALAAWHEADITRIPTTIFNGDDPQEPSGQGNSLLQASSKRLAHIVENLMEPTALEMYPYLDPQAVNRFRQARSSIAYACRFHGCARGPAGFPDQESRDDHERKSHAGRFWCPEPSCALATSVGFPSQASLKKHWRTYHAQPVPKIPVFRLLSGSLHSGVERVYDDDDDDGRHPPPPRDYRGEFSREDKEIKRSLVMVRREGLARAHRQQLREQQRLVDQARSSAVQREQDAYPASTTSSHTQAATPRILLVEDDTTCRIMYQKVLQSFPCVTDTAFDSPEAVVKMDSGTKYDLVLMNIRVSNMDSLTAVQLLRHKVPIIAVTSDLRRDDIGMYFQYGMTDVLPKPFTKESLLAMVQKHLPQPGVRFMGSDDPGFTSRARPAPYGYSIPNFSETDDNDNAALFGTQHSHETRPSALWSPYPEGDRSAWFWLDDAFSNPSSGGGGGGGGGGSGSTYPPIPLPSLSSQHAEAADQTTYLQMWDKPQVLVPEQSWSAPDKVPRTSPQHRDSSAPSYAEDPEASADMRWHFLTYDQLQSELLGNRTPFEREDPALPLPPPPPNNTTTAPAREHYNDPGAPPPIHVLTPAPHGYETDDFHLFPTSPSRSPSTHLDDPKWPRQLSPAEIYSRATSPATPRWEKSRSGEREAPDATPQEQIVDQRNPEEGRGRSRGRSRSRVEAQAWQDTLYDSTRAWE